MTRSIMIDFVRESAIGNAQILFHAEKLIADFIPGEAVPTDDTKFKFQVGDPWSPDSPTLVLSWISTRPIYGMIPRLNFIAGRCEWTIEIYRKNQPDSRPTIRTISFDALASGSNQVIQQIFDEFLVDC